MIFSPFSSTEDKPKFFHLSKFVADIQTGCMSIAVDVETSDEVVECFKSRISIHIIML